jgi:uncharacterized iron-regulated membrane protein
LRKALRQFHAVLGIVLAAYVLVVAATGTALVFRKEALALAAGPLPPPPADLVARAERLGGPGITSIRFPDDALAAFTVNYRDGSTALFDPASLAPIDTHGLGALFDTLFDIHHHLAAGEVGEKVSGGLGLAFAVLVVMGLVLWWPWRRGFRLGRALPRSRSRASHLGAHTTIAILAAPALLVSALSGAAMVFSAPATALLGAALGSGDGKVAPSGSAPTLADAARAQFPAATPRMLIPAATPTLRLQGPSEFHPNGRTALSWDPASRRVTAATDAAAMGAGRRFFNFLYPLHIGVAGGLTLRLAWLLSGLAAIAAAVFGVSAYLRRRRVLDAS